MTAYRQIPSDQSVGVQRKNDRYFDPVEKVLWKFKNIHGVNFDEIDTGTWTGKNVIKEFTDGLKTDPWGKLVWFTFHKETDDIPYS